MGTRIKTFDSTGTSPNGRLFAGDLNAIQDQYADQTNLAQTHAVGTLQVGETGLQLTRFGSLEARITGALRTDGILRGLGGLFAGTFTTTARNAISSPPFGLIILNTTTNQFEWNAGTPSVPNWQAIAPPAGTVGTSGIADGAVTSQKIADGTVAYVDLANALKPSQSALSTDEALRALGTGANNAAPGNDTRFAVPGVIQMYAGAAAPTGWLLCDGSLVSRTTFSALFTAISTAYGAGDGSTTFNLPDLRGRVPVGLSSAGPTLINALGKNEGVTVNNRNISHRHAVARIAGNGASAPAGGIGGNTSDFTSGDVNNTDYPAFQVVNFIIKT